MNRLYFLVPAISVGLTSANAVSAANRDQLLRGTFSITGSQVCLASPAGFNANLTPKGPNGVTTSSIIGTRSFDGDGTASDESSFTSVSLPPGAAASSGTATVNLTYEVAADRSVVVDFDGALAGQLLTGPRAGQTFTIDRERLVGKLSEDGRSLTLATPEPTIETLSFSNGDVQQRICHETRILIKVDGDTDADTPTER